MRELCEATREESRQAAANMLREAARCLDEGDDEHAAVWLQCAKPWVRDDIEHPMYVRCCPTCGQLVGGYTIPEADGYAAKCALTHAPSK